jgi:hypothetical protein
MGESEEAGAEEKKEKMKRMRKRAKSVYLICIFPF